MHGQGGGAAKNEGILKVLANAIKVLPVCAVLKAIFLKQVCA